MMQFFRVTPPSVHQMVLALEQAGLISRQPGVPRARGASDGATRRPPRATRGVSIPPSTSGALRSAGAALTAAAPRANGEPTITPTHTAQTNIVIG